MGKIRSLAEASKITKIADPTTAGTTDVTTSAIDMNGFESVLILSSYGTAAADNLPHAENSPDGSTGWADLLGTEVNVGASDEDVWLEIIRPNERYLRVVFERGTSSTLGDIWVIQFDARSIPQDNTTAGTIHGESHVSPAEGTI